MKTIQKMIKVKMFKFNLKNLKVKQKMGKLIKKTLKSSWMS